MKIIMKKKLITSFIISFIIFINCSSIALAENRINDLETTAYYQLYIHNDDIFLEISGEMVNFNKKPYRKEFIVMLPLKEFVEAHNQKINITSNDNQMTKTITLNGKNVTFFKDEKRVMVDGKEKYLLVTPDFVNNDIFIGTEDLSVIFYMTSNLYQNRGIQRILRVSDGQPYMWYRDIEGKKCFVTEYASWYAFRDGEDKGKDRVLIRENDKKYKTHHYYINENGIWNTMKLSAWYATNSGFPQYTQRKGYLLTNKIINTYEKDGKIMMKLDDMEKFSSPDVFWSIRWDKEQKTAHINLYHSLLKDIVLKDNSNIITLNGTNIKMSVPAEIRENNICIPIETVFDILEIQNIEWIENGKEVFLIY